MRTTPIAVLALAPLFAACGTTLADEEMHRFPGPVDSVHLDQRAGDVTLTMTPRDDVRVRTRSHHVASERPSVLLEQRDGTLSVGYTRQPGVGGSSVDFDIEIPSGVAEVVGRSRSGDLDLHDFVGDLDWRGESGDLEAERLFCTSARVSTDTGDVTLDFTAPPEWVSIETRSGDVDVVLPGGGWAIRATSRTGDVRVDPGMLGDSAHRRVEITTDSGDVRVRAR